MSPSGSWRPLVIFASLGSLLLLIAFLLSNSSDRRSFLSSVLQNVALIALTIVLVEVLWSLAGREPVRASISELERALGDLRHSVQLLEDSQATGLRRIHASSGAAGSHDYWMTRLRGGTEHIDLMGYSLHIWTRGEHFEHVIESLARSGSRIRVLLMDQTNVHLLSLVNSSQIPGLTAQAIVAEIEAARRAFATISDSLESGTADGSFEVRVVKKGLITSQIIRTNAAMTVIPYLYHAVASRSPMIEVHGEDSDLFDRYQEEYDRMWDLGTPV